MYAGWDVARNRDLSVIWLLELVGDVTWTRGVIEMRNLPTPDQVRQASQRAGTHAPTKALIFSGDQRPDFSRRNGITIPRAPQSSYRFAGECRCTFLHEAVSRM